MWWLSEKQEKLGKDFKKIKDEDEALALFSVLCSRKVGCMSSLDLFDQVSVTIKINIESLIINRNLEIQAYLISEKTGSEVVK